MFEHVSNRIIMVQGVHGRVMDMLKAGGVEIDGRRMDLVEDQH